MDEMLMARLTEVLVIVEQMIMGTDTARTMRNRAIARVRDPVILSENRWTCSSLDMFL